MRRALVTGAAGQLGRALVRELRARDVAVNALVRTPIQAQDLRAEGADIYAGTLSDTALLATAARGVDVVFHLAGGVRGAGDATADVLNRDGTARLLEALRGLDPVVVFASSAAVHGDRSGLWVGEDYPAHPDTAYGASKLAAERLLRGSGHRVRIARLGMVLGVGPTGPMRAMHLGRLRGGRAWLPGDGTNHVPVVHLEDALAALILLAETGDDGTVAHIAAPGTPSLRDVFAALASAAGAPPARFLGTWIPSAIQRRAAGLVERTGARAGLRPPVTPDTLTLWSASVRLRTDTLAGLGFAFRHGEPHLDALLGLKDAP